MTNYTKANLRDQALVNIGVLDPTESADGQTIAKIDPQLQQFLEYLDDENLLIFDPSVEMDVEVIPGRIMPALQNCFEIRIQRQYGTVKPRQEEEADWQAALRRLRRSILQGHDPIPASADFF